MSDNDPRYHVRLGATEADLYCALEVVKPVVESLGYTISVSGTIKHPANSVSVYDIPAHHMNVYYIDDARKTNDNKSHPSIKLEGFSNLLRWLFDELTLRNMLLKEPEYFRDGT